MNARIRELLTKVEAIGWKFDGYDGNDHVRVVHESGIHTSIPATPSEYRSVKNSLATLERLCGQKLPRPNAARYRRGLSRESDEQVAASRRRHAETWDQRRADRDAEQEAERRRRAEVQAIQAAERRRREIEDLMR